MRTSPTNAGPVTRRVYARLVRLGLFLLASLFSVIGPLAAASQSVDVVILGTVSDQTGAVLPGASARATAVETGVGRRVVTDAEGRYRLPALSAGAYRVGPTPTSMARLTDPEAPVVNCCATWPVFCECLLEIARMNFHDTGAPRSPNNRNPAAEVGGIDRHLLDEALGHA